MLETRVLSLGQEDLLDEGMATHSSTLAWRIPWTDKPGGLPSMPFAPLGSPLRGPQWAGWWGGAVSAIPEEEASVQPPRQCPMTWNCSKEPDRKRDMTPSFLSGPQS